MPRISSFFGIIIEMYFGDHPPPHFHARYGDEFAAVAIDGTTIISGSLSRRAHRLVREWAEQHSDELAANWERVVAHKQPERIEPLR